MRTHDKQKETFFFLRDNGGKGSPPGFQLISSVAGIIQQFLRSYREVMMSIAS